MATRAAKRPRSSSNKGKEKWPTPKVCQARQNVLNNQRLLVSALSYLAVDNDFVTNLPRICTSFRTATQQGSSVFAHLNFTRDWHSILHKPSAEQLILRLIAKAGSSIKSINVEPRWLNNLSARGAGPTMDDMRNPFGKLKAAAAAQASFVQKVTTAVMEQKATKFESLIIRFGFDHRFALIREETMDFGPIEKFIQTVQPRRVVLGPELYEMPKKLLKAMPNLEFDGFRAKPCQCTEGKQPSGSRSPPQPPKQSKGKSAQKGLNESKVDPILLSAQCEVCNETMCTKCGIFDDCYREMWLCIGCNRFMCGCTVPHQCNQCDAHSKLCTDCRPRASYEQDQSPIPHSMLPMFGLLFGGMGGGSHMPDEKEFRTKKSKAERSHFAMPCCPATNCTRRICGNQCLMHCAVCLEVRCGHCIVRAKDDPDQKPICNTCKKRQLY